MPITHKDLSRHKPHSSRDLSVYTIQELDQIRRSNATLVLSRRRTIKLFFWDPEHRTVFHLTGRSWLFILTFYPLFIALILAIFYGIMQLIIKYGKSYGAKTPIVNKNSLTHEPVYQ